MRDRRTLVHRVADRLRAGPAHTLEIARDVLGLTGHPGAVSAAVFTLLGSDPRFHVDPSGLWALEPDAGPVGIPLDALEYAVVDVETTGGSPDRGHRITEVALVEVRGGEIRGSYRSLVNPGRPIPPRIVALTGISDEMVAGAPPFEEIAPDLVERLDGRVFVAHNAGFDWRFLDRQLGDAVGWTPGGPRLCTMRMARRLVGGLRRRNLDHLARHFGIPIEGRHRAYGDALATARVFLRLLDEARRRGASDLLSLQALLEPGGRVPPEDVTEVRS